MQPLRPYERMDSLKQFLDHDRHVLRFNCYWDDTDSMFGDSREMVRFFLSNFYILHVYRSYTDLVGDLTQSCFYLEVRITS